MPRVRAPKKPSRREVVSAVEDVMGALLILSAAARAGGLRLGEVEEMLRVAWRRVERDESRQESLPKVEP